MGKEYGFRPYASGTDTYQEFIRTTPDKAMLDQKIRRHSEFKKPYMADSGYQQMEYDDSDPPHYRPGSDYPKMGLPVRKPSGAGGKSPGSEIYDCWVQGCCCDANNGGFAEVICTYPFDGPYKKPKSSTDVWVDKTLGSRTKVLCSYNPAGESCESKYDDLWCMVHGPTQNREQQVFNLVSECGSECATSVCCTGVSISGMPQMRVGTSQTLGVVNGGPGCTYEFKKLSGGGTLQGNVYTAPDTNPGCINNATIGLYEKKKCQMCSSISIAINASTGVSAAYRSWITYKLAECKYDALGTNYYCDGTATGDSCAIGCTGNPANDCKYSYGLGDIVCDAAEAVQRCVMIGHCGRVCTGTEDWRTAAMIAAGCCPSQLL